MRNIQDIFMDRTCHKFSNKPIEPAILKEIYDLMKLGPTSANCCPLRISFIVSLEEKEKLYTCLDKGNIEQTKSAPVTAIFAYDSKFYQFMPLLFPHNPTLQKYFSSSEAVALDVATKNSTLQAAYFMMLARGKNIACGPLGGFSTEAINKTFFSNSDHRVNFLCNLGYMEEENSLPRLARLEFEECCKLI